jgi:3-hydroxyacyl-[acyl-carrier-protein] dehydratase
VASSPLFDISGIDLRQVRLSAERVAELNPQCGPMRQLSHVVWAADDFSACLGVKLVRHDEFWVSGHIPGRPLLPGVLMIEAAAQLCSVLHHLRNPGERSFLGFTRCDDVSFRGQVIPGDTLYLLAQEVKSGRRRFVSRTQGLLDGRIVFEATITGMQL